MRVIWHGHSCFEICSDTASVVIDPHDGTLGIKPPETSAAVVLATRGDTAHKPFGMIKGDHEDIIGKTGRFSYGDIEMEGLPVNMHDAHPNVVYRITVDGMTLCHCGDLGAVPSAEITDALKGTDFLMVPAGEVNTLNIRDLFGFIDSVSPRVVIPMHYYVCGLSLPLRNLDRFLRYAGNAVHVGNEIDISKDELPPQREYWVFSR